MNRDVTFLSSLMTVFFSTVFIILLLLNRLDNNTLAEEKLSFNIYQRVFKEIGKPPYYPEHIISSGRAHAPRQEYRVGKQNRKTGERKIELVASGSR